MGITFGELQNAEYEMLEQFRKNKQDELLSELKNQLQHTEFEFEDVTIDFAKYKNEGDGLVKYRFTLTDGFTQEDTCLWSYNESIEKCVENIIKYVEYIMQLRTQYPEFAKQNDFIQKNREYTRTVNLKNIYGEKTVKLTAKLCEFMKLPNQTSCSIGGGDYEIKRTPRRVKDYNENIDTLCLFLADCIAELRSLKYVECEK